MTTAVAARVGVVVLDHDQAATTAACLGSLVSGTVCPGVVVVVENGSMPVGPLPCGSCPDVEVLRPGRNLGPAGGRNAAVARLLMRPAVETIVVLDNDATVNERFVARVARQGGGTDIVAPLVLDSRGGIWSCGGRLAPDGDTTMIDDLNEPVPSDGACVDWTPGACMILPRSVWEVVGPFDEAYRFYFEDAEWCLRASRFGYRVVVDTSLVVVHEAHASLGGGWSPARSRHWGRSGTYFRLVALRQPPRELGRWLVRQAREIVAAVIAGEVGNAVARARGVAEGLVLGAGHVVRQGLSS